MRGALLVRVLFAAVLLLPHLGCDAEADVSFSTSTGAGQPKLKPVPSTVSGSLTFVEPGDEQSIISAQEIHDTFDLVSFTATDSNYGGKKKFVGVSLAAVLKKYLPEDALTGDATVLLTASDGYAVEAPADVLLSPDAFLAVGHTSPGDFDPIGDRGADPRPFYLTWRGDKYTDEKKYPHPWSLVRIALLSDAERLTHTRPPQGFGDDTSAKRGYELFSASCIRCHAINQEGGKVGPDLNVPQNILAYRPEEQVRAYIKNPAVFRYSSMPAHPQFNEQDLDALVAYLRLMGNHQHDPAVEDK